MAKEAVKTPEQLAAECEELKKKVAALEAEKANSAKVDKAVLERMASGLSRDQAEAVVAEQKKHDEYLAKRKEQTAKK